MMAGRMNCKLELLRPNRVVDRMGAEKVTYSLVRTVWAERIQLSGKRSEEVGEHFPTYSAQYLVRIEHPVEENWRVRQLDGYLYVVEAIEPNKRKGFKKLICERVNE